MSNPSESATLEIEGLQSLARLEQRILETVEQLRAARREKQQAEKEAALLRERLAKSQEEVESLRAERRQVSERLEKLLAQVDLLSKE